MRKFFRVVMCVIPFAVVVYSQDGLDTLKNAPEIKPDRWVLSLNTNLLFTVNTYSNNWTGSEEGTITWISQLNGSAKKQLNSWLQTQNFLKLAFGETYTQDDENERWSSPSKTTDLIDVESRMLFTLGGQIDPFVSARMISQFWDRRDTLDDLYINPLELTESFGGAVDIISGDNLSWNVRLGGALRQTIDREAGEQDILFINRGGFDLGSELTATTISGVIEFSSLINVYQAVVRLSEDGDEEDGVIREQYWYYPDMNWENSIKINVARYIMLNAYVQLLYDKELVSGVRLKETFSFGLTYSFIQPKKGSQ